MKIFKNIELKFSNWNKQSPILFQHIANSLIGFQAIVIPSILSFGIESKFKTIFIGTISIIVALVKFLQKLTADEINEPIKEEVNINSNIEVENV